MIEQRRWWQEVSSEDMLIATGAIVVGVVGGILLRRIRASSLAASAATEIDMGGKIGGVPAGVRDVYLQRYDHLAVRPERLAEVDRSIDRVVANRAIYERIGSASHTPWFVVGAIHLLELSLRMNGHLHNGDPLTGRTTHVPADRPISPPANGSTYTFEESGIDAMSRFRNWTNWGVSGTLYQFEKYNGWGYQNRGVPSPYLYSFSNQYTRGKYGSDGNYDPDLVSRQVGAATLIKRMEERGIIPPLART